MRLLGILLIGNSLVLTAYWVTAEGTHKAGAILVCLIAVFAGLALTFHERITELSIKDVGTIKVAAKQAQADAAMITELKNRVEAQSATVDLVADQATKAKQLSQELADKNKIAEEKLATLDTAIVEAQESLSNLESASEYHSTFLAAQGDDREAYDRLKEWAEDESYPFRFQAEQAWNKILDDHSQMMFTERTISWKEGVDPSGFTLTDLRDEYQGASTDLKPAFIGYIWKREDIPEGERLAFLVEVLGTDKSLKACEYAGRYFKEGTELKVKPLAIDDMLDWWEENKDQYIK
jgi:hypothetical protein